MQKKQLQDYLHLFVKQRPTFVKEMEVYAKENHVPIMDVLSMEYVLQFLRLIKPKRILELGTAIGYSSIRMAMALPESHIVTIERNEPRIQLAKENIDKMGFTHQITLIEGDALEVFLAVEPYGEFDVIFIDAAKGQYQRFFQLYEQVLASDGVVISDNVLLRGDLLQESGDRRRKDLIRKVKSYNDWIRNHINYETMLYPIGDGIMVSKKISK